MAQIPKVFCRWLASLEYCFDHYNLVDYKQTELAEAKLVGSTKLGGIMVEPDAFKSRQYFCIW